MSSGSYFPGPVRAVEIPKDHGAGVQVARGAHGPGIKPVRSSRAHFRTRSLLLIRFTRWPASAWWSSSKSAAPGTERVLVCEGGPAGRVTLPVGWTDRAPCRLWVIASPLEGLAGLSELVAAMQDPPLAERGSVMILYSNDRQERPCFDDHPAAAGPAPAPGPFACPMSRRSSPVRWSSRAGAAGKEGCRCASGDLHGPYTYVVLPRAAGRTRTVYVPAAAAEAVRRGRGSPSGCARLWRRSRRSMSSFCPEASCAEWPRGRSRCRRCQHGGGVLEANGEGHRRR